MRAFVSGGRGFLGKTLVPRLKREGWEVDAPSSKECDLTREDALDRWTRRYDWIFHLAAWTQAGDFCLHHPGEQWILNQKINTNLLQWWQKKQSNARAVFIGTSCAYDPDLSLCEENYLKGEPTPSLFTYAMTKRMLYIGAAALGKQYGLSSITFVPSTLCGPYYHQDGRQMHFIYDLVRKIKESGRTKKSAILWGDGTQKREIIHVEDFVNAVMNLLIQASQKATIVNIGAGKDFTIKKFAEMCCLLLDVNYSLISWDTSKYVGAKAKCLKINKLREFIPTWNPRDIIDSITDVKEAISKK